MRTTKELEELGWLVMPTAKQNYLQNPLLQELFPTYDDYAYYNYEHNHAKWNTGSRGVYALEGRGTHSLPTSDNDITVSSTVKEAIKEITETDDSIDSIDLGKELTEESQAWGKYYENKAAYANVKVKKLKYHGKKEPKDVIGLSNTVCPCCTSRLVIDEVGITKCSGDRLREWELEFLRFNKLNDDEKRKYLILQANSEMFVDLYEKWNTIDIKTGFRASFECGYTNRIFNPISRFRTSLPDPVMVKKIERSLGRELTEEEKHGESDLWLREGVYSDKYRKGSKKVKIPQVVFPDGVI